MHPLTLEVRSDVVVVCNLGFELLLFFNGGSLQFIFLFLVAGGDLIEAHFELGPISSFKEAQAGGIVIILVALQAEYGNSEFHYGFSLYIWICFQHKKKELA